MVCAGSDTKDGCHGWLYQKRQKLNNSLGDSGGPLAAKNAAGSWFQYGIVSWGNGACVSEKHPTAFARVSNYCDFIESSTNGEIKCQDPDN